MIRFTAIRLFEIAAMLVLMSFVIYALIGLMPGDPIDLMRQADPRMSAADVARLKTVYGLDQPLLARYLAWAWQALAGDLGYSRLFAAPVWWALLPRLGNSLLLMGSSFILALALALALGTAAARRPNSRLDAAINLFCFAGVSMPTFWLALVLILLFAAGLGWLPASGIATAGASDLGDRLSHLALPVMTLTLASVSVITGSTKWLRRSPRSLVPAVAMPLAGSQPSPAANSRISTRASQKVGIDTPAKHNRLIAASSREFGRRAAAVPSASASASARMKLDPISNSELPSRGSNAHHTGAAKRRE